MWDIFIIKFSSIIKKELGRAEKTQKRLEENFIQNFNSNKKTE